jgi:SmpA / OmlA family
VRYLVLFACVMLAACSAASLPQASLQNETEYSLAQKLQRGVTTKEQVRGLLGDATKVDLVADGVEQWTYQQTGPEVGGNYISGVGFTPGMREQKLVMIVFDRTGVLYDYTMSSSRTDTH